MRKPLAGRASNKIDFAALTGRKADLVGHQEVHKSLDSTKRGFPFRESEDEYVEDEELSNRPGPKEAPKRQRYRPGKEKRLKRRQTEDSDSTDSSFGKSLIQRRVSSNRRPVPLTLRAKLNQKSKRASLPQLLTTQTRARDSKASGSSKALYPRVVIPPLLSTPNRERSRTVISISSDESDGGEQQQGKKPAITPPGTLREKSKEKQQGQKPATSSQTDKGKELVTGSGHGFEAIKTDPLTDDMKKRTIFLVTIQDSPLGPVPVPFTDCSTFTLLFPILISERGVPDADAKRIDTITTIFSWTGGEFGGRVGGIRKGRVGDWVYFCETLRRAHERDADRWRGMCEVVVKLHVNEKQKEKEWY